jgi:acyl carrier protein phosphodiesterase
MAANLAADWMTLKEISQLPDVALLGVQLHKEIDAFTDAHPSVRRIKTLLRPIQGKYSPVAADLIIDFLLAHHWYRYYEISYADFCTSVYGALLSAAPTFPIHIQARIVRLCSYRWLNGVPDSINWIKPLSAMDQRAGFPSQFFRAGEQLLTDFDRYDTHFNEYMINLVSNFPTKHHRETYLA